MAVESFPLPPPFPTPHQGHEVWTVDDLDLFSESTLIEVLDGALIVNPPPTNQHRVIQGHVVVWLTTMDLATGTDVLVEPGIRFGDTGLIADAGLGRVPSDTTANWLDPHDVLIVVEVLSPSTRDRDLGRKRDLYSQAEITYVIVDPAEQSITVHDDSHDLDIGALATRLGWTL